MIEGPEFQPESLPPEQVEKLLRAKILTAWGVTIDQLGSANVYRTVEHLYRSLYHPEEIPQVVENSPKFPDRLETLTAKLPSMNVPEREIFMKAMRRAMTEDIDFRRCLYPDALPVLSQLIDRGQVTIWTAGDAAGFPDQAVPGSKQQMKKLFLAGLQDFRKAEGHARQRDRHDILDVIAAEDKMRLLPDHQQQWQADGVDRILVIDDRLDNLRQALAALGPDIPADGVWVRQDKYGNKGLPDDPEARAELLKKYHAVNSLGDVIQRIDEDHLLAESQKPEILLDYDGVMANDSLRSKFQTEAVVKTIRDQGWIDDLPPAPEE